MDDRVNRTAIPAPDRRLVRRQRQVRRYSRAVGWMKIILPACAMLLVVAIFLSGRDSGSITDMMSAEELARLGTGMRLEKPRFAGETDSGDRYLLRADWAMPDGAMPVHVALDRPSGELVFEDGRVLSAQAETGDMNRKAETLTLNGNVVLSTSDGYRFATDAVVLDLKNRGATSDQPVDGSGPTGSIQAGSFRAEAGKKGTNERKLWFENGVRVVILPEQSK